MKNKFAIILPLKENFSNKNFGAVSVWVKEYMSHTKTKNNVIFCRKLPENERYLNHNVIPINIKNKLYTNSSYIKLINIFLIKNNITHVEIHNRPEYAQFLLLNNPVVKVNLVFHNDPNTIRGSKKNIEKKKLLKNCNKIIFVSKWIKNKFFQNLAVKHQNNSEIIYNFVNLINKFPKKQKIIIFSGKLNKSKGYDIFGSAVLYILEKYPDWKAIVCGSEEREKFLFHHNRLKIYNWVPHKKILDLYKKSSISVVNPTWDEPFGRTALESASRGCAVITSKSGGLDETFKNNLILKVNSKKHLIKLISKLIEDQSYLRKIQKDNFLNIIHKPFISIEKIDKEKYLNSTPINYNNSKSLKIIHIGNFGERINHRLFNISISHKLTNAFIRNGHDVINIDYRNFNKKFFNFSTLDDKILEIVDNYRPNLILLGHNNVLLKETLVTLKNKFKCRIALWYEDHLIKGDPNYRQNLDLIEKNHPLIDQYFITTPPDIIKTKIPFTKLNFLPIPVDHNIESGKFYEIPKHNDLFFALSNGVNFGKLKPSIVDERTKFIDKLIKISDNKINFNILGLYDAQPKWNYEFNKEMMFSKTALNLSRGGHNKYVSSNRIATLMGNGILPFIHEKVKYQDFFDNDEIITYKNSMDLISKLSYIKNEKNKLIKRSKNAKKRYFEIFENTIVADFLIYKIFNNKKKFNYIWKY